MYNIDTFKRIITILSVKYAYVYMPFDPSESYGHILRKLFHSAIPNNSFWIGYLWSSHEHNFRGVTK